MNNCIFSGNVGNIKIAKTSDGISYANISLAVRDSYNKDKTNWINLVLFGERAEKAYNIINKGDKLFVETQARVSIFENTEGKKFKSINFVINHYEKINYSKVSNKNEDETTEDDVNDYIDFDPDLYE